MSVVHLAIDPMEFLKKVDKRLANVLEELEKQYGEFWIIPSKEEKRKVRVFVVTESSTYSS